MIAAASGPIAIDRICAETGLHPNTVRPHLEVLLATGAVTREQGKREGPGRPPWLYRAAETMEESERRRLAESLVEQLQGTAGAGLAEETARRWAGPQLEGQRPAASVDEVVDGTARSLADLGFEVAVAPGRDRIDLMQCPYLELIAERPVICDIHAALLQRLLRDSGQPVGLDRLDVLGRPGVCTAHLARNDYQPQRTITMRSAE